MEKPVQMILPIGKNLVRKNSSFGFTLLEILLVAIILTIIAGMIIPNFSQTYKRLELKRTAQDIVYLMRYAQSLAVTRNIKTRFEFDSEFSKYWLSEEKPGEDFQASEIKFERITGRLGKIFKIPPKIQLESSIQGIYFYPDGRIDKQRIYLCQDLKCLTVSTVEQRGHIWILDSKVE